MNRLLRHSWSIEAAMLAAILAVGTVIRFSALSSRGLIYWDEAKFGLEGMRLHAYLQSWFGSHASLEVGKTIGTAKPTHALLIALAYAVFGLHDYAPLFLDALCSVLAVGVTFFLARRLFGPWVGLVSALFLAVSEYDVIYARSALSESDADLLFVLAVLCWSVESDRSTTGGRLSPVGSSRMLLYAALLAGAAFTTNYRLIVYAATLLVFDLIWAANRYGWKSVWRRLVPWIAGLLAVPVLWQVIDVAARLDGHVLFRSEVNVIVKSGKDVLFRNVHEGGAEYYLVQALFQLHGGKQSVFKFDPVVYLQWFVLRQGWVISALLVIALILSLRVRMVPWLLPAALVVVPYVVYVFAPFIVPRNLDAALPFGSILAAAALVTMCERIPRDVERRVAVVLAGCAIAAYGASLAWRLTPETSGFAQAATYLEHHGDHGLATNEVMVFYLPGPPTGTRCNAPAVPDSKAALSASLAAGYRYAVLESFDTGSSDFIVRHARRVGHYRAYGPIAIGENPVKSENGDAPDPKPVEYINVYDLSTLRLPSSSGARPPVCSRNVPI